MKYWIDSSCCIAHSRPHLWHFESAREANTKWQHRDDIKQLLSIYKYPELTWHSRIAMSLIHNDVKKIKMAAIFGGHCTESLWRDSRFAMIDIKKWEHLSGEAYILLSNVSASFLKFLGGCIIPDAMSTNRYSIHFARDIHWFLHLRRSEILPL